MVNSNIVGVAVGSVPVLFLLSVAFIDNVPFFRFHADELKI